MDSIVKGSRISTHGKRKLIKSYIIEITVLILFVVSLLAMKPIVNYATPIFGIDKGKMDLYGEILMEGKPLLETFSLSEVVNEEGEYKEYQKYVKVLNGLGIYIIILAGLAISACVSLFIKWFRRRKRKVNNLEVE